MDWLRDQIRYKRGPDGRRRVRPLPEQLLITQAVVTLMMAPLMMALGLYLMTR